MSEVTSPNVQILRGNTIFCNNLYNILSKKKGNVFFSPLSIHAVLSMAYQGARGKTKDLLSTVLNIPDIETTALGYKSVLEYLNSVEGSICLMAYKIYVKKSMDEQITFIEGFENSIREHFYADVEFMDFSKKEEAAKKISGWVKEKTQNTIEDIVDEDMFDDETALMLINAIYFKGEWMEGFKESSTVSQSFFMDNDKTVEVKMMKKSLLCNYKDDDELGAQIIELPYRDNKVKMIFILPCEKLGINALETRLGSKGFGEITNNFIKMPVTVSLPKFTLEETIDLDAILLEVGLANIYDDEKADFKGMVELTSNENLFVGKIVQKAFIEVNEKGTEAAATTVVKMKKRVKCAIEYEWINFEVNHPAIFLLVAYHDNSVNIIFCGRLVHPLR